MTTTPDQFEEMRPGELRAAAFVVDLEGFEGPLDLLLTLAREQKVDLRNLSILALAEQYLEFVAEARRLRLEVAADYLVMAAWLAYLKSRLLLPDPQDGDEPTGEEMAHRLQFQLERLQAMREVVEQLMQRDRLGIDVFARGLPEGIRVIRESVWECSLFELLQAYADQSVRGNVTHLTLEPPKAFSVEESLRRLESILGRMPDWASLESFLPPELTSAFARRSAVASTLSASLELTRDGRLQMRQAKPFGPIFVKAREPE
ncbi:MAG: ScpA family protein [Alphaproteobacteria bacterium]|jgi:segregation and condensation protein A|nr:ScpA family protein [Alphaproteobacteria bacterium]